MTVWFTNLDGVLAECVLEDDKAYLKISAGEKNELFEIKRNHTVRISDDDYMLEATDTKGEIEIKVFQYTNGDWKLIDGFGISKTLRKMLGITQRR